MRFATCIAGIALLAAACGNKTNTEPGNTAEVKTSALDLGGVPRLGVGLVAARRGQQRDPRDARRKSHVVPLFAAQRSPPREHSKAAGHDTAARPDQAVAAG